MRSSTSESQKRLRWSHGLDIPTMWVARLRPMSEGFERQAGSWARGDCCRCWLLVGLMVLSGCSTLARERQREDVVQARQIALRGMDAAQAQQWGLAEQLYRQAVEICPVDERARRGYAEALWELGDRDQAIEQMREAVRLSGNEGTTLVRLGEMYLAVGDLHHAEELAKQAVDKSRQMAAAYRLRGDIFRAQGAWQEALACYHRALSIQSDFPSVQMAVAQLYFEHQRPQRALSTLQSLAEQYPPGQQPVELVFWHGLAYQALGRHEQAVTCLAEADRRGLRTPELLYQLAEATYRAGDLNRAQQALNRAWQLAPEHPAAAALASSIHRARPRLTRRPP